MSAMVTHFPREHARLLPYIKQIILGDRTSPADAARVRVGVSTNFNKLCGMEACTAADVKKLDAAAVRSLYALVDFVGISSYPRYHGKLAQMEDSTQMFDTEMKVRCLSVGWCWCWCCWWWVHVVLCVLGVVVESAGA